MMISRYQFQGLLAAVWACALVPAAATTFEFSGQLQADRSAVFIGSTTWEGLQNPGLSQPNQGVIYFDTSTYHFEVSENGGAYFTLQSGQILIDSQTFTGENTFANSLTLQSSSITLVGSGAGVGVFLNDGTVAVTPAGFSGNGAALTDLNGAALTGTDSVPWSVLPTTVAYTSITNTFTAAQQFGSGAAMSTFTATGNLQMVAGSTISTTGTLSFSTAPAAGLAPMIFMGPLGVGFNTSSPLTVFHFRNTNTNQNLGGALIESNSSTGSSPRIGFVDDDLGSVTTAPVWYTDNYQGSFRIFEQPNYITAGTTYMTLSTTNLSVTTSSTTIGSAGTAIQAMGSCSFTTTTAITTTSGTTAQPCAGIPETSYVAVRCSGSAAFSTAADALECRGDSAAANSIFCHTSGANTTNMTYACFWVEP